MHALVLLALVASAPEPTRDDAPATEPAPVPAASGPRWTRPGWGFGGVPALAYNPDNGLTLGVVGNVYDYDGTTAPYKNSIHFLVLFTTKLVQHHDVALDAIKPFDLPLRLNAEVGFYENLNQNYCGLGPEVTCDDAVATRAAKALGLGGDARDAFLRHYYTFPYIEPYASVNTRWRLNSDDATKLEAQVGWRGSNYITGTIFDDDKNGQPDFYPYPNSRYAADFPGGEPGFASVFQAGIIVDHRDNEPSPRHGWLVETSVRGAHPVVGSAWSWAGANLTLRGYTPVLGALDHERRLILASRVILDGIVGDPPLIDMARIGGSVGYSGYGGGDLGRGIRGQRYLGRVKILEQQEIRWHFYDFEAFDQRFGLITNLFLDAGLVGRSFDDWGTPALPIGMGGAFLISWNENFIVRVDVATSSVEGWSPYPYITLGQSF